jgi:amino acid permease
VQELVLIFKRFSWVVIIAAEVLAVAQLWNFRFSESYLEDVGYPTKSLGWQVGQDASPAIWVCLFLALILLINCLPVREYGRLEYIFGCFKLIFIVGLILFNIIINGIQRVAHPPNGRFWTYDSPNSFRSANITIGLNPDGTYKVLGGSAGGFLALWTAMTTIIFSLIGFESVSIAAAETVNPEDNTTTETMKMATRKISLRIILLYSLATLAVGLNVPYTDTNLRDFNINDIRSGEHSVFILAAVRNHMRTWPHLFNGVFIFTATTSGINSLYISSRILHALASIQEVWPNSDICHSIQKRLARTKWGVPYGAVFTSWLFGLLAFLATKPFPAIVSSFLFRSKLISANQLQVLGRMATNSIVSMLIVYAVICASYLQFYKT